MFFQYDFCLLVVVSKICNQKYHWSGGGRKIFHNLFKNMSSPPWFLLSLYSTVCKFLLIHFIVLLVLVRASQQPFFLFIFYLLFFSLSVCLLFGRLHNRVDADPFISFYSNVLTHSQVVVPKMKSEILGVVVVESGWGSMVPTVVIANLSPTGAAAKCGQLNIGDQIIAINGVSLVGLPLSTCQNYIKVRNISLKSVFSVLYTVT